MFKPVDNRPAFPKMEHEVLDFWEETDAFRKLQEKNRGNKPWSFIDGPITASNKMGVHHGWGRTYKDIFQRYHAMLGQDQRFQNGFDCQGLWVEVEVEKALGFNSKREIENYGLDRFAQACRALVMKYAGEITRASIRLGQWMDWDDSYYTMSDTNIEHIWLFLKKCHENGWLYMGTRSMPWCWRCGTSLSQHELIDSYEERTHRSVFLKFPLNGVPSNEYRVPSGGEQPDSVLGTRHSLLVWTTTPWTLTANVAAAVHPDLDYARIRQGDEVFYLSRGTVGRLFKDEYRVEADAWEDATQRSALSTQHWSDLGNVKGSELVGLTYRGPFDELEATSSVLAPATSYEHRVIAWDAVGEEEGTGIVHIAPGCGAEDFELSKVNDLPIIVPLNEAGGYGPKFGQFAGMHVTDVAPVVFDALKEKGLLYHLEDYTHRYPTCWRCHTDLVFRVATEWYIRVEEIRPRLMRAAREVKWHPEYAGKRMENWLVNMSDWNISRKRYWGLVLPFYVCDCGEVTVIGSTDELREIAVNPEAVDALPELHRPWVDEVKIKCPKCGDVVSRVPEVGDAWLDAGIVPFSTLNYRSNPEYWAKWFPAGFITEMREQIRLWFYSMLIMSVTLEDTSPYKEVLAFEKVHDEHGKPMHKSWGNAIWFDEAVEIMGADVMRWMYASAPITQNMNFGYSIADEVKRNLLTLWNTYSFFVMYANLDGWTPQMRNVEFGVRNEVGGETGLDSAIRNPQSDLDRWILARLHELISQARAEMDTYDVASLTRQVDAFVDDLSNWYVRRSRRRFWKSESDTDKLAAYSTLYEVLVTLTKLVAPVMPFLAETMYQNLVKSHDADGSQPESVHHCAYPEADEALIDRQLLADVALTQRLVSLARAARNKAGVKVRQPLREMVVRAPSKQDEESLRRMEDQVLEELNVKGMVITSQVGDLITYVIKPNLPALGPKYGKRLAGIRAALSAADPAAIAAQVEAEQPVTLRLDGEEEPVELLPSELLVETREKEGFAVAQEGGLVVALDTELDESLLQEGLARDLVRIINDMRKSADFDVSDRIQTFYSLDGGAGDGAGLVRDALANFGEYLRSETLSNELVESEVPADAYGQEEKVGATVLRLGVRRVSAG
ncbi:MAG TPA: isoleucine--tRNA ligase [Chloroflexia bacterium]|nr:isoleucine--tRNA ligase [Chloroflexia bacterium]